jgi:hypothetical protein
MPFKTQSEHQGLNELCAAERQLYHPKSVGVPHSTFADKFIAANNDKHQLYIVLHLAKAQAEAMPGAHR